MEELAKLLSGINWFISIVGAILLSILGNLLTTPVQNLLARRSMKRSKKRVGELKAQLSQIETFVNTPSTFYLFIISIMTRVTVITLIAFALSDMTSASINASVSLTRFIKIYPEILYAASQLLTALFYVIGVNYTLKALRVIKRVQHFSEYKGQIEKAIASLTKASPAISTAGDKASA
ncbi:MAG TPA: hypothetical protein VN937_13335 [Blastocatellia bacterium]|nr:hypothetical protein [Blastocatellia bacterium]